MSLNSLVVCSSASGGGTADLPDKPTFADVSYVICVFKDLTETVQNFFHDFDWDAEDELSLVLSFFRAKRLSKILKKIWVWLSHPKREKSSKDDNPQD